MRILVVEDDPTDAELLKEILTDEGYAVDVVNSGNEGELLAQNIGYHCILLDLLLPGKDGLAVCQSLRKKNVMTPVMIVTGKRDQLEDIVLGLDHGADDYLLKPYRVQELLARIRALLRRGPITSHARLKAGDLVLDTNSKQVWKGRQEVFLTVTEFTLLEVLVRQANTNVKRSTLEGQVWPLSADHNSNVLEVHIRNLRQKLESENIGLIRTVKGIGYRLETQR